MNSGMREKLIFEILAPRARRARAVACRRYRQYAGRPTALRRQRRPQLPEVSELDVVRHYTRLSQLNFSIDTHFYPLGSLHHEVQPEGV